MEEVIENIIMNTGIGSSDEESEESVSARSLDIGSATEASSE
jgi:hypothetical protein